MGLALSFFKDKEKTKVSFEGGSVKYSFAGMQEGSSLFGDPHIAITNFDGDPTAALFAIFDSHGGTVFFHSRT